MPLAETKISAMVPLFDMVLTVGKVLQLKSGFVAINDKFSLFWNEFLSKS